MCEKLDETHDVSGVVSENQLVSDVAKMMSDEILSENIVDNLLQ